MFFVNYSTYEGRHARLYRSPEEIIKDIGEIKDKINEINEGLNIRDIVASTMGDLAYGEPEKWIARLEQIVDDANETLDSLRMLQHSLDELYKELEDVRCLLMA